MSARARAGARWAAAALIASAVTRPAPARGEAPPSVWQRADDPGARARWDAHVLAWRQMVSPAREPDPFGPDRSSALERARVVLEAAIAKPDGSARPMGPPRDLLLRFDLGAVYSALELPLRAIEILEPTLAAAPTHPSAVRAWDELAIAYARVGRREDERRAYDAFLGLEHHERSRATAVYNVAESLMLDGRLREAVARYREAVRLGEELPPTFDGPSTFVLSLWGLAVALDRAGDPQASMREVERVSQHDPTQAFLHHRSVFFEPPYERYWYEGLHAMHAARDADRPRARATALLAAEQAFRRYVADARPGDRFVGQAKERQRKLERERRDAERKLPPVDHGDDDEAVE